MAVERAGMTVMKKILVMKQYNRIMLGEGSKYIKDCLENNYIGANFLKDIDLSEISNIDENTWSRIL